MSYRRTPGYRPPPADPIPDHRLCAGTGKPTTGRLICPPTHGGCPSCHAGALLLDDDGTVPRHEPIPEQRRPVRRDR